MTRGKKILIGVGAATAAFLLLGVGGAIGTEREVVLDTTLEAQIASLTAQTDNDADTIASLEADAQTNAEMIAVLEAAAAEAAANAPDTAALEADAAETIAALEAEIVTVTAQVEAGADTIASLEADAQADAEAIAALETAAAEADANAPDTDVVAALEADAAAAAETIAALEVEIDALNAATQEGAAATDAEACDPAYPGICLPPADVYDIDLDCGDVEYDFFEVTGDDPYIFDLDGNGLGCERGSDPSSDPNRPSG